jgi:hypothetical protein
MASHDKRKTTSRFTGNHDDWGILGKTEKEAQSILEKRKMKLRVVRRDGESLIGTTDIKSNRVKVYVDNKKVSFIVGIG